MWNRFKDRPWYPYTVTACIAVFLYVALTHLSVIGNALSTFVGYFSSVIIGLILAYIMNPLAKLFQKRLFGFVRSDKLKWTLSVVLAVIAVIAILVFMLGTLIPQLAESVLTLVNNMDVYMTRLQTFIDKLGLSDHVDLSSLSASGSVGDTIVTFLKNNANDILHKAAASGKGIANWLIAFILAVYMLMAKNSLKEGAVRLLKAVMPQKRFNTVTTFFARCDRILVQYIVFSLLDSLIVGAANAIFMKITGMQYVGLVSMVVAITNLIPTFGPIIGYVVGGFILLLVEPLHALIFIIFSIVLQFFDGYILKPKLFSGSLGVSGLLIIIAVIVFGNMFGIIGILLAIPAAAILDFLYEEVLLTGLEKRRKKLDEEKAQ